MKRYQTKRLILCYIILLILSLSIASKFLRILNYELIIRNVASKGINYDEFRNIRIDETQLNKIKEQTKIFLELYPIFEGYTYMDEIGYLTFSMMISEYNLIDGRVPDVHLFLRGFGRVSNTLAFRELYGYYKSIFSDIKYFPIPYMGDGAYVVSYEDSWYAPRSYGGNRSHEGTDIMAGNNTRGYFPIISITDGVVEKMGWLEQGGNRIGIRSNSGGYFYYAHLDTYAPNLKKGDTVMAGQLLGFMGDSGYGKEGTKGKFDVHLHLGIYVPSDTLEMSVNPYWILKILEKSKTELMH